MYYTHAFLKVCIFFFFQEVKYTGAVQWDKLRKFIKTLCGKSEADMASDLELFE